MTAIVYYFFSNFLSYWLKQEFTGYSNKHLEVIIYCVIEGGLALLCYHKTLLKSSNNMHSNIDTITLLIFYDNLFLLLYCEKRNLPCHVLFIKHTSYYNINKYRTRPYISLRQCFLKIFSFVFETARYIFTTQNVAEYKRKRYLEFVFTYIANKLSGGYLSWFIH